MSMTAVRPYVDRRRQMASQPPRLVLPENPSGIETGMLGRLRGEWLNRAGESGEWSRRMEEMRRQQREATVTVLNAAGLHVLESDWVALAAASVKSQVLERSLRELDSSTRNRGEDAKNAAARWETACNRYHELRLWLLGLAPQRPQEGTGKRELTEEEMVQELEGLLGSLTWEEK